MIFNLIIKILFRKEIEEMAVIYAALIIKGKKTFADVPVKIQDKVKEVLIDLDCPELAE
ncbi:MAG: hypothetical protein [Bacteriophage sp.]|nr:MAG: hypothetical protein [Bacteriophage sp.]